MHTARDTSGSRALTGAGAPVSDGFEDAILSDPLLGGGLRRTPKPIFMPRALPMRMELSRRRISRPHKGSRLVMWLC